MAGELVTIKGKCNWAMVHPGQERAPHPDAVAKGADPSDRSYAITVECSQSQFRELQKKGLNPMHQLKFKEEADGTETTWLTIKATKKKTTAKGSWVFEDPKVVDAGGNKITKEIGNGSDVIVTASLEDAGTKKALRLKAVQVVNLVEYTRQTQEVVETPAITPDQGIF